MADPARLCIHQVSFGPDRAFRDGIDTLARGGVDKTAVWLPLLDQVGAAEGARILRDAGVRAVSLCPAGFLTGSRPEALDRNRRWLNQAAEIGAKTLVTITGGFEDEGLETARSRAQETLQELLPLARAAGVKIALEPLHPMVCGYRSVISSLREANDWLDAAGAGDELGIAFDTYALWWEPDLATQIARAGRRIVNFHCSDWLRETRDLRLDRGMLGAGVIDNRQLLGLVDGTGFQGPVEVEIFSAQDWWRRDPDETVAAIRAAYEESF